VSGPVSGTGPARLLVELRPERCTACGCCLATCPTRALRAGPGRPALPRLLADRCTGCLACVEVCPRDALVPVPADLGTDLEVPA
jgi:MinD superfamily P-loop ATPase